MIGQVLNSIHDGKITDYISSFILDRLREKYDVEFDVLAIGNYDMASGRVVAVCCARDDSKICFKVIADRKNIQDSYIRAYAAREVEKALLFNLYEYGIVGRLEITLFKEDVYYGILVVLDNLQTKEEVEKRIEMSVSQLGRSLTLDVFVLNYYDYTTLSYENRRFLDKSFIRRFYPVFEFRFG